MVGVGRGLKSRGIKKDRSFVKMQLYLSRLVFAHFHSKSFSPFSFFFSQQMRKYTSKAYTIWRPSLLLFFRAHPALTYSSKTDLVTREKKILKIIKVWNPRYFFRHLIRQSIEYKWKIVFFMVYLLFSL